MDDVITLYNRLSDHGIRVWLTGGWGIDALLHKQTRPHKDLDVIVLVDDVARLRELLGGDGYGLKELWSENCGTVDAHDFEIPTAFVLNDAKGRELDVHAVRLDERGDGIPAWEAEGFVFRKQELGGEGMIGRLAVPCLTPEMQMRCHTGYELPAVQLCDLELLREKFEVGYPDGVSHDLRSEG